MDKVPVFAAEQLSMCCELYYWPRMIKNRPSGRRGNYKSIKLKKIAWEKPDNGASLKFALSSEHKQTVVVFN